MRKFNDIYKDKLNESESLHESKVLESFKQVYNALLENYKTNDLYKLTESNQLAFLSELSHYWSEDEGLSDKGKLFLENRSSSLTSNSTSEQKKNYIKSKIKGVVNESLRLLDLKYKVYDVIDDVYKQVNGQSINDVLTPNEIVTVIKESLNECFGPFVKNINIELNESATAADNESIQLYEKEYSEEKRKELSKKGYAEVNGSYPIVNKSDLKNAIKSFGRSKNKDLTKKHIIKRAKALDAVNLLPKDWSEK